MKTSLKASLLLVLAASAAFSRAGTPAPHGMSAAASHARPWASHVVIPQSHAFAISHAAAAVRITEVNVGVVILEQAGTTTMDISLDNPGNTRQEAELLVPVPDGAVLRGFIFQGAAAEPTAQLLPKDEARKIYNEIVAKVKDPALLEFAGYNLIRSSVFPVEARATQKVRLTYEHLLPADGSRVDYVLPRSESIAYNIPWKISVRIESKRPISAVYSPSHAVEVVRVGPATVPAGRDAGPTAATHRVSARVAATAQSDPGPFRLSYLLQQNDAVTASLFTYPDPKIGGGYFLLLAGAPSALNAGGDARASIKREVTVVIDRSGSMNGEKMDQAREAALQVLSGLDEGEAFNVIVYNEAVDVFSRVPVIKNKETMKSARAYLQGVQARGGTNIHDALLEALRQKPTGFRFPAGQNVPEQPFLPIVLFLTDGLPTIGQTSEAAIRDLALKNNPYHRRIFTFGVGLDVNTPLLDKTAAETRGTSTFVLPKEDVEVKVSAVFKRLAGPVLADTRLDILTNPALASAGKGGVALAPAPGRVRDVLPGVLPDLFEGDQLVLLGQYVGDEPVTFALSGNYQGTQRTFKFSFAFDKATTRNAFVPRLWASRKIAVLVDAVRQMGADAPVPHGTPAAANPKMKEIVDEIVRLSKDFGILTEYTAFLAKEGTDLSKRDEVLARANGNFWNRAVQTRSGQSSYNQDNNLQYQRSQACVNYGNSYWDENMNRVSVSGVQQISDRAFFNTNGRWVDSRISDAKAEPHKVVQFGSEEFLKLAQKLADEGRQGCVSLKGEIMLQVDGQTVLVK